MKKREIKESERFEEENEAHGLENGEKLVAYKSTNALNNMLPSVRDAHLEAAQIQEQSEKRKQEDEKESFLQKR